MSVSKLYKTKVQHVLVFAALAIGLGWTFDAYIVSGVVQGFVKSQFKPEKKELVNFQNVYATPSKKGDGMEGSEVQKQYIDGDFIFDFTQVERNEKIHGYKKAAGEWFVKAPPLGEHAIILEPYGFFILSFNFGVFLALIITIILPPGIGWISLKIEREISNVKAQIRLQTGFSKEIVEILTLRDEDLLRIYEENRQYIQQVFETVWIRTMPDDRQLSKNTHASFTEAFSGDEDDPVLFRNQILYGRINEHFSEFVLNEIVNSKGARKWQRNRLFAFFQGVNLYMRHYFTEKYSNFVTGLAYGGAAFLIIAVGIRGLKFIPASRPSLIFFAILLEFTMLALLAVVLLFTEGEERMDKMLKKMEDANKSQLDTLDKVAGDMNKMATTFEGGTSELMKRKVEDAVAEYLQSANNVEGAVAKAIGEKIKVSLSETFEVNNNTRV